MQEHSAVEGRHEVTTDTPSSASPEPRRCAVAVVGAGISGLTTAWHLHRSGVDVILLEAKNQVGGSIETEKRDGFLLEKGPFNVMVRDPAFEELLTGLGDAINVVQADENAKNRYIYRHGKLIAVPGGPGGLLATPLLSFGGRMRALRGLFLSSRGRSDATTLDEFATRRFGREVSDTLVSAAVAGILAGDISKLNAYACFPMLRDFDQRSISPLGRTAKRIPTMIRKKRDPKQRRKWKGLVSIDRGLGGLCQAIADTMGDRVLTAARLDAISRGGPHDSAYTLNVNRNGAPVTILCDQLVLATAAGPAARLLAPHSEVASELIGAIESSSITVINLAYPTKNVRHPLDGFGFLVPRNEPEFPLMGALFANSAFPHHAPPEYRLLRAFIGGSRTPDVISHSTEELVSIARKALEDVLGATGEPILVDVCPYPDAIPQYRLDHVERIARTRKAITPITGLHLAGNYLDGVSISDCIKLGKQVAHTVAGSLQPQR